MIKTTGKWLVRAGSLILLIGFFIPSMAVSCTGTGAKQSFSLYDIATSSSAILKEPLLFLVILAGIAAIVFSFTFIKAREQGYLFLIGQLVSVGIGAISLFFSIITLYGQFNDAGGGGVLSLEYSLEPGFFVLLLGYGLSIIGIIMQAFGGFEKPASIQPVYPEMRVQAPLESFQPPSGSGSVPQAPGPYLETRVGGLLPPKIPLKDNLYIGRSHERQVQLPDSQVSRQHARFRVGNGAWFIQDQGSASGTFVNGKRVQAIRLNSGDQIKIGETTLTFRM